MRLLVPYLFPATQLWQAATPDLRLPTLQKLVARGRWVKAEPTGVEGAVCRALGIERQADWPVAPLTLAADGGTPGTDYWLRADPVHLAVMRDRVVLAGTPSLTVAEAGALAQSIRDHFGDDFAPEPLAPTRWYLRLKRVPDLVTTPPSLAVGHNAVRFAPQGRDRAPWQARLNELQMLLHGHPVNAAREVRGVPTVNSLWLWGGGLAPEIAPTRVRPAVRGFDCETLAHAATGGCAAPAPGVDADVIVIDTLIEPGQSGHLHGWREAMRELDSVWLAPLRRWRRGFTLEDPVHGRALILTPVGLCKFWVRGKSLAHTHFDH